MINAIKFSIGEIEASDQYFDHTAYHCDTHPRRLRAASFVLAGSTAGNLAVALPLSSAGAASCDHSSPLAAGLLRSSASPSLGFGGNHSDRGSLCRDTLGDQPGWPPSSGPSVMLVWRWLLTNSSAIGIASMAPSSYADCAPVIGTFTCQAEIILT